MDHNPQTELYAHLVNCGLLTHIGQGGKETTDLPKDIKEGKKELSPKQQERLNEAIRSLVQHIEAADVRDLKLPGYTGSEPVNDIANLIVTYGVANSVDRAEEAHQKLKSLTHEGVNPDMDVDSSNVPERSADDREGARESAEQSLHEDASNAQASAAAGSEAALGRNGATQQPNVYRTSGLAARKYSPVNSSILQRWQEHNACVEITGDQHFTVILFQYMTIRRVRKDENDGKETIEYSSLYGVQRKYNKKYCYELARPKEISQAGKELWESIDEQKKLVLIPSKRPKFRAQDYGELNWFYFGCYKVPEYRREGKMKTSPTTICPVEVSKKDGIQLLILSEVQAIDNNARKILEITSKRDDVPPPWKARSKNTITPDPKCHRKEEESDATDDTDNAIAAPRAKLSKEPRAKSSKEPSSEGAVGIAMSAMDLATDANTLIKDLSKRLDDVESAVGKLPDVLEQFKQDIIKALSPGGNPRAISTREQNSLHFPSPSPESNDSDY
ncbi:hypothetical protein N7474_010106 [Penicillium riverlandense]|uniref:uncharacterized protein n=1 Tax=Penicillium riverlandense TaxID=1903569 RepID=UPI002548C731|nr:uncharacterized protein N7474_010106 [Penicillium riverlandense]KAJ5808837.1 hypothetical protein N7474_010106 [Penicillium riverlandense]